MRDRILPFYLVCDESYSMSDHLRVARTGLAEVSRAARSDPAALRHARFCLIGFSATARIIRPLSPLHERADDIEFQTATGTNFGPVFALLRETIENDVAELTAAGGEVLRPVVFFLSDGQPTDSETWLADHARLVDPGWPHRPRVVAFGIGDADAPTVGRVGTHGAYLSSGAVGTGEALRRWVRGIASSMVNPSPRFDADALAGFTPVAASTTDPGLVNAAG